MINKTIYNISKTSRCVGNRIKPMSKITVWTSKGKWSEEVTGCDKIHLMKHAIKKEAEKFRDAHKSKKGGELEFTDVERCLLCYKDGTTAYFTKHWSGIQIDNKRIDLSNILDYYNNIDYDILNEYIRGQTQDRRKPPRTSGN